MVGWWIVRGRYCALYNAYALLTDLCHMLACVVGVWIDVCAGAAGAGCRVLGVNAASGCYRTEWVTWCQAKPGTKAACNRQCYMGMSCVCVCMPHAMLLLHAFSNHVLDSAVLQSTYSKLF